MSLTGDLLAALELQAELAAIRHDHLAGATPSGMRRSLFDHELDARVNFAELEQVVDTRAGRIARRLTEDRQAFGRLLADDLAIAAQAAPMGADRAIAARLGDLGDPTRQVTPVAGSADLVAQTEQFHADELRAAAHDGATRAVDEARRQGIPAGEVPGFAADAEARIDTLSRRLAAAPHADVVTAARHVADRIAGAGLTSAEVIRHVVDGINNLSNTTLETTYARPAVQSAHNLGHQEAASTVPAANPPRIYASELLDRNTCGPCSLIDGHEYRTELEAVADYPTGTYIDCEGGDRCRGTLVYVWAAEAPATIGAPPPTAPPYPFGTTRPTNLPPPPDGPAPAPTGPSPNPRTPAPTAAEATTYELPTETIEAPFTDAELADARRDIDRARLEVRELAKAARTEALGVLEHVDAISLTAPPPLQAVRNISTGAIEYRNDAQGWDWFYGLHPDEQKRLRRTYVRPAGGISPDELAAQWNARYGVELSTEDVAAQWLDITRRADAASTLSRGRLISPDSYGGLEVNSLVDTPYNVRVLFGADTDAAAVHLAGVTQDLATDYADRMFATPNLGRAPYAMTREDFVDEVARLEALLADVQPIRADEWDVVFAPADQANLDRYRELIPDGIDTDPPTLSLEEVHEVIMNLAGRAGLA